MKITLDKSGTLTLFEPAYFPDGSPQLDDVTGKQRGAALSINRANIKHHLRDPELRAVLGDDLASKALAGEPFECELSDDEVKARRASVSQ
jgi:hypothetical protein